MISVEKSRKTSNTLTKRTLMDDFIENTYISKLTFKIQETKKKKIGSKFILIFSKPKFKRIIFKRELCFEKPSSSMTVTINFR